VAGEILKERQLKSAFEAARAFKVETEHWRTSAVLYAVVASSRSCSVVPFWGLMLASLLVSPKGAETAPALELFSLPRPQLRSTTPVTGSAPQPDFALQTRSATPETEALVQQHAAMNGSSPLRARPAPHASRYDRTVNWLLKPKAAFFGKNPNARRNPLEVDGW
jgi:hypothetical protein